MNQRVLLYLVAVVLLTANSVAFSETGQSATPMTPIKVIVDRQAGPEAVKLEIKTNKAPGETFKQGDRIIFYVRPDRACHLAVLNVAANGDITILFPNKGHTVGAMEAGKDFVLFGDDAELKLVMGKSLAEAKTYFLASSKPFSLSPLEIPKNKSVVRIPSGSEAQMRVLADKVREMAEDPSFNQVSFPVKGEPFDLNLMGPAPGLRSAPSAPRMPSKDESESPESITGVSGVKHRDAK